ncbi:MAG: cytochrome c family protein [Betaproteobacteria bacterium]|nr:cytochrome c family protein [Betaproteobacteria bacterium]
MKNTANPLLHFLFFVLSMLFGGITFAAGDPTHGIAVFRACIACHSVEPDEHMTGPSLAHLWGRKAGTAGGFTRYSDALKHANVVWDERTLDQWLRDPAKFIPHNDMTFPGIESSKDRRDVIAYLKAVSQGHAPAPSKNEGGMGMMIGRNKLDLKNTDPKMQVVSLEYCGDTYIVKTATEQTYKFWEFNLRLQTDSSKYGPLKGKPIIVGTGMMGDRAAVIFTAPREISSFIKESCH